MTQAPDQRIDFGESVVHVKGRGLMNRCEQTPRPFGLALLVDCGGAVEAHRRFIRQASTGSRSVFKYFRLPAHNAATSDQLSEMAGRKVAPSQTTCQQFLPLLRGGLHHNGRWWTERAKRLSCQ